MFTVYGFDEKDRTCPSCINAKKFLQLRKKEFKFVPITDESLKELKIKMNSERFSLPQIWYNDEYVGGFSELKKYI